MKIPNILFYTLALVFFFFAIVFVAFQNASMTGEEGGSQFWLIRTAFLLDAICLLVMFSSINRSYKGVHLVCILWMIIMPIIMYINHSPISDTVRTVLWPILFEATYLCCRNQTARCLTLKKEYYILAAIGLFYFLTARMGYDRQTNTIYFVFLTLPWLIFSSNKRMMLLFVFIFTVLALLSMKRSTILAMVLTWAFYFLMGMKSKRSIFYTIAISIIVVVGLYFAYDKIDERMGGMLTERVNKEETDTGKSREAIWELTIFMIQQSPMEKLVTGHGHFGVRRDSWLEISAHNDFLEVIYDYGLVILLLYVCLWIYVLKRGVFLYHRKSPLFMPYAASLSIFIVMSMVSHLILYTSYFNYLVMFWGMTEALVEIDNRKTEIAKRIQQ